MSGEFQFELKENWPGTPIITDTAGVTVDSRDSIYVLNRHSETPVLVLNEAGEVVHFWGKGHFKRPHAIFAGPDDAIYCVDDQGHALRKYTPRGELVMEIETSRNPADTGYIPGVLDSVKRSGPPFNTPTGIAVAPEGDLIVSDGYGNARIHRFSSTGKLVSSFGEPGHGPGQFFLPHGVAVDQEGRIYVADRENSRVQVFSAQGMLISEWRAPRASCVWIDPRGMLFVAEMGEVVQGQPGRKHLVPQNAHPRVSIRNRHGEVMAQLLPPDPEQDGLFFSPHSICMDSKGNIYVTEVSDSFTGGLAPKDRPRLHKYIPL